MSLSAVLFIGGLFFCAYVFGGIRDPKRFLLFAGIVSVPFEITYSFYHWHIHDGWTSGVTTSLSELCFIGLLFLRAGKSKPFQSSPKIVWAIILFIVASGLSGINSEVRKLTIFQMLQVAQLFLLYYWTFANCVESREDIRAVLDYQAFSMLLQGAFCAAFYLAGLNFNAVLSTGHRQRDLIVADNDMGGGFVRAIGSFPQPNGFAAYLVPLLLVQLAVWFGTRERKRLRALGILGGLFGLVTSFSRGGWIGLFICFPLLLRALGKMRWPKVVFLYVALAALGFAITPVRERIFGDDRNSAASRIPLIHLAVNIIKSHPFVGVGANTYAMAKYKYLDDSLDGAWLDEVHNMYLLVFAETGMIGLIAFLMFLSSLFNEARPAVKQNSDPLARAIGLGVRFGLIASMMHMCVDMFLGRALLSSLFLACGLLTAVKLNLTPARSSEGRENFSDLTGEFSETEVVHS